jgi:uncharacterized protein YdeI (YjbR/CyaY-like superfamily)
MEPSEGVNIIVAFDSADWRAWLEENGEKHPSIWLIIYHKNSRQPSVYYDEAVDDALCYGWIDSAIRKRDHESYYQYFARRNPKSNWSKVNREKVERLIDEGKMQAPGLKMVELARQNGTWAALDLVEALVLPDEMMALLEQNPLAKRHFEGFPRNVKRGILEWIYQAKKPETRATRIEQTIEKAQQNIRILFDRKRRS